MQPIPAYTICRKAQGHVSDLVVQDTEPQPGLPLPKHHLHHLVTPGGGVGEDLQGPGPRQRALPDDEMFSLYQSVEGSNSEQY